MRFSTSADVWTAGIAAAMVASMTSGAALGDSTAAPSASEAPAQSVAPTPEGPIPAHVKAQAQLDRDSAFGSKMQFAARPVAPPAEPIVGFDGTETTLAAHKGSVVVAVFWATWCHVCADEMPEIDAFAESLGDAPITVLPISLDAGPGAEAKIKRFYEERLMSLPMLVDQDRKNAGLIGLRATPTAFVLNAEGNIVSVIEGRGFWNTPEARKFLETLAEDAERG
ncbi:MAG: TlpA disulfide reductase family protein [Pseudomonadota bacterium]